MTEEQIAELRKPEYYKYYDREDWAGAAEALKAANLRVPARPVSRDTFIKWFSDELLTLYSPQYAVAAPDAAAAFKALYEAIIVPQDMINVGSPRLREMLEAMKDAQLIVDNDRFGTADEQIESVCTERWEPTAEDVQFAVRDDTRLAEVYDRLYSVNGTVAGRRRG